MSSKSAEDINGQNFNHELYLQKMFKECTLKQIMDREAEIVKDTQTLHSDMQTLVYENYNKFISATDTVRKMKNDFKKMEDEMDLLEKNMESITSNAVQISSTLQDTRTQINKLSGIHTLLKRLQFLFKLPTKLKSKMEEEKYTQAVQDYMHAQRVLQQYGNMPSFQGIQDDCEAIVSELKTKLRKNLENNDASAKQLTESVELLLQLKEPADELCAEFLACAEKRLGEQLVLLQDQSEHRDIIEFVDLGCSGFLNDLCLVVSSFKEMFSGDSILDEYQLDEEAIKKDEAKRNESYKDETIVTVQLNTFILNNMQKYFGLVRNKVELEQDVGDTVVLVRALDRFHRRLQAMANTLVVRDQELLVLFGTGTDIVINAGRKQCRAHLQALKVHLADSLARVRQNLATPKRDDNSTNISEMLTSLIVSVVEKIKGILQDLLVFIQPDITFGLRQQFRDSFCVENVRENLVVGFIHHLTETAHSFCVGSAADPKCPAALLLLLSKLCVDFQNGSVHYLISQTEELFGIGEGTTSETVLNSKLQQAAQELLNYYVRVQGLNVSQMLRKSVETRDWLHTIEPRTVRAVMKRVVEDIAAVDTAVALLYEDQNSVADHSSDSSRKAHSYSLSRYQYHRSANWSGFTSGHVDSSIVSNIHKLFSERIEIFSPVDFDKVSILTGVIKISLKTFLECVRLKTYSKFGLQQIQVDTHYLQLYLWRFVADENLVHFLLDEILSSAVHRCLEPVLMEPSVVDIICERG